MIREFRVLQLRQTECADGVVDPRRFPMHDLFAFKSPFIQQIEVGFI